MAESLSDKYVTAWFRFMRTSQITSQAVANDLKAAGFPPLSWYDILQELHRAPQGKLRLSELREQTQMEKSNVTRLIDRLEKQGLVEREDCFIDRRGAYAAITVTGRAVLMQMWSAYRASLARHFASKLTEPESAQLALLLRKLQR